jgi:hypothetical protein
MGNVHGLASHSSGGLRLACRDPSKGTITPSYSVRHPLRQGKTLLNKYPQHSNRALFQIDSFLLFMQLRLHLAECGDLNKGWAFDFGD